MKRYIGGWGQRGVLYFCGFILSVLVGLMSRGGAAVWADGGGNSGSGGITVPIQADCNSAAVNHLCDNGGGLGSGGGGASWRLYETTSNRVVVPRYYNFFPQDAYITGCKKSGWYLQYGYETTAAHYGKLNTTGGCAGDCPIIGAQLTVSPITGAQNNGRYSDYSDRISPVLMGINIEPATQLIFNSHNAYSGVPKTKKKLLDELAAHGKDRGSYKVSWETARHLLKKRKE